MKAFAKDRQLHFPLLADFHPKGAIATSYRAYREEDGGMRTHPVRPRQQGVIFCYCSPIAVKASADGIPDALEAMPNERKNVHAHAQSQTA
jgi:peroxiredoxin